MENQIAETAKALGISEEEVRRVAASLAGGTWNTKINSIITHVDGTRHWSSQECEQCL